MIHPYSMFAYGRMLADERRVDAYVQAMRRFITPESVVLDLGSGTGYFAVLACALGARRVFAVDPSPAVHFVKDVARANGVIDRLEVRQALSTDITLPERADVLVFDLRGVLPLFQGNISAIADARERLLRPGAVLIPVKDTIWAAPVAMPLEYSAIRRSASRDLFGIDMSPTLRFSVQTVWPSRVERHQLASDRQVLAIVDYRSATESDVSKELTWRFAEPQTIHGLTMWFESTTDTGIQFESAPGYEGSVYGQLTLPFEHALDVGPGTTLEMDIEATLIDGEYTWSWDSKLVRDGAVVTSLSQCSMGGRYWGPLPRQGGNDEHAVVEPAQYRVFEL